MIKELEGIKTLLEDPPKENKGEYIKHVLNILYFTQLRYKPFVLSISPSEDTLFKTTFKKNSDIYNLVKDHLTSKVSDDISIEKFSNIKYLLEKIFYTLTERGELEFIYQKEYLLTSKEMQDRLNVSRATLMRMVKNGMEVAKTTSHRKYPAHNAFYWKTSLWASRIQALKSQYDSRHLTEDGLKKELFEEIVAFEKKYDGKFENVFTEVLMGKKDMYDLDEPDDFKDWQSALEELGDLIN